MSARVQKVAAAIKEELAFLIGGELKDPRIQVDGLMTISAVEVTGDLRIAKVWMSFVGTPGEQADGAIEGLTRAAGFMRGEIGRALQLRHTPELRFMRDRSQEESARIGEILKEDDA